MTQRIALGGLLSLVVAFGATVRLTEMRTAFCEHPDELAEVMPGLRLHALPLWNLGDDVRSNFVSSMLYSHHGLGDTGFYYLASAVLGGFRLPISERNLWIATGVSNALLIGLTAWLLWSVERSRATVIALIIIMAASPFYVLTSQSGWGGRLTFVPLIQVLLLWCVWVAVRGDSRLVRVSLLGLTSVLMLTDGFFFVGVLVLCFVLSQTGSPRDRIRRVLSARAFWYMAAGAGIGLAVGIALALTAAWHGNDLTLYRYVLVRGASGDLLPNADTLRASLQTFQWYFADARYFWVVLGAWCVAAWQARRSRIAGTLAVWWLVVAVIVIRYAVGLAAVSGGAPVPSWANAPYHLALPSYLLLAWLCGFLMDKPAPILRLLGGLTLAAVALPLGIQAASGESPTLRALRDGYYPQHRAECEVVKAASYYVREHGTPASTVFHVTSNFFLGFFGEFYYGLSYSGNPGTGERNQLFDFGLETLGRRVRPEDLARVYGVPHFDYYVEFLTVDEPLATEAVARLHAAGARPVFEIHERGTAIGRVWSFDPVELEVMESAEAARRWNRFATLTQLVQQPLAGTAYHFGYRWLTPQ